MVVFTTENCLIQGPTTKKKIGLADVKDGLYILGAAKRPIFNSIFSARCCKYEIRHYKLGHISSNRLATLHKMYPKITVPGTFFVISVINLRKRSFLSLCQNMFLRMHLIFIHIYIWGPTNIYIFGFRYFLTIVDDYTRFTWAMMMKKEAAIYVHHFQFGKNIKVLRSDNGPEFNLVNFYALNGIIHYKSCVETSQQNGIGERKHQHILYVARCLQSQSNLPKSFLTYFIGHVIHIIKRTPTPLLDNLCPYQKNFMTRFLLIMN